MNRLPSTDIYDDTAGEWRWRLRAANGRIIADSAEGYKTMYGATRALMRVVDIIDQALEAGGITINELEARP